MTGKPSALRYRNDDTNTVGELIGDLGNMYRMNNRSALLRLVKEIDFFLFKARFFFLPRIRRVCLHMSNFPFTELILQCSIRDSVRGAV